MSMLACSTGCLWPLYSQQARSTAACLLAGGHKDERAGAQVLLHKGPEHIQLAWQLAYDVRLQPARWVGTSLGILHPKLAQCTGGRLLLLPLPNTLKQAKQAVRGRSRSRGSKHEDGLKVSQTCLSLRGVGAAASACTATYSGLRRLSRARSFTCGQQVPQALLLRRKQHHLRAQVQSCFDRPALATNC